MDGVPLAPVMPAPAIRIAHRRVGDMGAATELERDEWDQEDRFHGWLTGQHTPAFGLCLEGFVDPENSRPG